MRKKLIVTVDAVEVTCCIARMLIMLRLCQEKAAYSTWLLNKSLMSLAYYVE